MRSAEIAKIANVSTRTLRHYHQMGLIPEPPRHANSYRDYSAADLALLLRIKRLAALGFALSDIKGMLDDEARAGGAPSALQEDALERLDAELEQQIEQLQEQRRVIAALRAEQLDPALPVRFAKAVKRLYRPDEHAKGAEPATQQSAVMAVVGHVYTDADVAELERIVDEAERLGLLDALQEMERRIEQLPADKSEDERAELVDGAMHVLRPLLPCFSAENWEDDPNEDIWRLVDSLQAESVNEAQLDVNQRIEEALLAEIRKQASRRS